MSGAADVGFLITVRRRADARKGKVVLFDVNSFICDSLATMKLLPLFPMADDLTGALLMLLPSGRRLVPRAAGRGRSVVGSAASLRGSRIGPARETEFRR